MCTVFQIFLHSHFNSRAPFRIPSSLFSITLSFIVQFSSVAQSCPTLSDLKDYSMPCLPENWRQWASLVAQTVKESARHAAGRV